MLPPLLKSLAIDPQVLLLNGVLFLITLAILNAIFWKPVMRHLEQRKTDISNAFKEIDDTHRELDRLRSDYQARLAQIEAEARGRIQTAVRDAQAQREQMISEARAQAEEIKRQGETSVEQEKERTIASMRDTLDRAALDALARAMGAPPDQTQRHLVDEFIAQNIARNGAG